MSKFPRSIYDIGGFTPDESNVGGDLHFTGTIADQLSDLIAGSAGTISTISVYADGSNTPVGTVNVNVTKASSASNSLWDPYDYSGTFDATLSGVTLQPGWNAFTLEATNADGFVGSTDISANMAVTA